MKAKANAIYGSDIYGSDICSRDIRSRASYRSDIYRRESYSRMNDYRLISVPYAPSSFGQVLCALATSFKILY